MLKGKHINLSKVYLFLVVLAVVTAVIMLVTLGITDNPEVSNNRKSPGYTKLDEYTCVDVDDASAPIGTKKEYTFILDDVIGDNTQLAFYTVHQYVEVYFDGENVYNLKPSDKPRISKTVGSNWTMIPVYGDDVGKEVRVIITPVYESFRDREVEFLIGSELAIYKGRLYKDLPQLILSIMAVFVGFIFVCVAGHNHIRRHRGKGLIALGIFSIMLGIWRFTDTRFTPFIFPNHSVMLFYLSVTMLMLGMIPLIKWMEEYFTKKSRRVMDIYCMVSVAICLIQFLLQFLGIADIREILFITHIVIAFGVILAIGTAIYERMKYTDKRGLKPANGLPYIFVAGVILDVTAFYVKGNSSGLVFTLLAFILYIVIMGIETIFNYSEQELQLAEKEHQLAEKDRALAENERKLTKRRIASMMSQIRSHFIFNVLTTISGYCKMDPQKADEALIRFSRYLRKNIKIIEEEGLIDFDVELEQLEDYVALEQLRFGDMIAFEKNIETSNFKIPPLTIQPLVENAIKHGLVEHNKSGVIRLSTIRKDKQIEIAITDDGVGFEPGDNEDSDSVGIRNVRYRLENMVGGNLVINSVPGEGTCAIITIPVVE